MIKPLDGLDAAFQNKIANKVNEIVEALNSLTKPKEEGWSEFLTKLDDAIEKHVRGNYSSLRYDLLEVINPWLSQERTKVREAIERLRGNDEKSPYNHALDDLLSELDLKEQT
jgi:hypothetical protein